MGTSEGTRSAPHRTLRLIHARRASPQPTEFKLFVPLRGKAAEVAAAPVEAEEEIAADGAIEPHEHAAGAFEIGAEGE